jgi:hypothetical protein
MDSLSIATKLTLEDWRAYQRACARRLQQKAGVRGRAVRLAAIALAAAVIAAAFRLFGEPLQFWSVFVGAALVALVYWMSWRANNRHAVPDAGGSFLSQQTIEFSREGVRGARQGLNYSLSWSSVSEVTLTRDHLFIWTDRFHGYVIPLRALPAGFPGEDFRLLCEAWREWAKDGRISTPVPPDRSDTD